MLGPTMQVIAESADEQSAGGLVIAALISVVIFWVPLYLVVRRFWLKRKLRRLQTDRTRAN